MKSFKKILCVVLASVLLSASFIPAFAVELEDLTFLYIDKGDITIGDGTVSGYGYFGQKVTTADANGYCIYMAKDQTTSHTVTISGGENYVALKNITITMNSTFLSAFRVENGAKADIFFTGTNTLTSGGARAGLEISDNSQVTLSGDGVLKAGSPGQAGIGGGSGASNGTVIINSGTIIAQCVNDNSAGLALGHIQQEPEDFFERTHSSGHRQIEIPRNLQTEIFTKIGFVLAGDEEIQEPVGPVGLLDELRLPDSPPPGQHGESRRLPGFLPNTPQNGQFLLPIIEFHRSLNP